MSTTRTHTLAVVSLVCGIASWAVAPFAASIIAILCGHVARRDMCPDRESGGALAVRRAMALGGLALGYLNLVASWLGLLVMALIFMGVVSLVAIGAAAG